METLQGREADESPASSTDIKNPWPVLTFPRSSYIVDQIEHWY
jgi:hypothetical protein